MPIRFCRRSNGDGGGDGHILEATSLRMGLLLFRRVFFFSPTRRLTDGLCQVYARQHIEGVLELIVHCIP